MKFRLALITLMAWGAAAAIAQNAAGISKTEITLGTLQDLSGPLAGFGKGIRAAIDAADKAGDKDTADLFTEISRGADKGLWFVESHLQ